MNSRHIGFPVDDFLAVDFSRYAAKIIVLFIVEADKEI